MRIIAGLGNPGEKYKNTRHNVGFIVLDTLFSSGWKFDKKFNAEVSQEEDTIYVKPQTFMNSSGESVSKILNYYEANFGDLLVIHDDVDLAFGEVKRQKGRGDAGHRGVESIISHIGSNEFERIRIGVGRSSNENMETTDWVLSKFSEEELEKIKEVARELLPF